MQSANVLLTLFKNIITRDYKRTQIIINLNFIINEIVDKLIYCEINNKIKNASYHLSMRIIMNFRAQKNHSVILDAIKRK